MTAAGQAMVVREAQIIIINCEDIEMIRVMQEASIKTNHEKKTLTQTDPYHPMELVYLFTYVYIWLMFMWSYSSR